MSWWHWISIGWCYFFVSELCVSSDGFRGISLKKNCIPDACRVAVFPLEGLYSPRLRLICRSAEWKSSQIKMIPWLNWKISIVCFTWRNKCQQISFLRFHHSAIISIQKGYTFIHPPIQINSNQLLFSSFFLENWCERATNSVVWQQLRKS